MVSITAGSAGGDSEDHAMLGNAFYLLYGVVLGGFREGGILA